MLFLIGLCKNIDMYVKLYDIVLFKIKNYEKLFEEWINYISLKSIIYCMYWNVVYWLFKIIYFFFDDCFVI